MTKSIFPATEFYNEDDCSLDEFVSIVDRKSDINDFSYASDIANNIPIYDAQVCKDSLNDPTTRSRILAEWSDTFMSGAGVVVIRSSFNDLGVLDEATEIYRNILEEEAENSDGADHFATSGANGRIWNSLQKLCLRAPDVFLRYFGNPTISAVCEAWLGPNYQMTAQINLVFPGGSAQQAHRDYHLGFQTVEEGAKYPSHVHDLSPVLTLQGAIAHCDMPIESGPTKLLPFSQTYRPGYAAYRRKDFREFFEANFVQMPLSKGDCLFFNPAVFHAAGSNTSENIQRMANLLQVSSAYGRALEAIDRPAMSKAIYPYAQESNLASTELRAAIAACAEGYSFPTNLDLDPPVSGLAPETQQALFHRALDEGLSPAEYNKLLDELLARQRP